MRKFLSRAPLVPIAIAIICGIVVGNYFPIISVVALLAAIALWWRHKTATAIIITTIAIGGIDSYMNQQYSTYEGKRTFRAVVTKHHESESSQILIAEINATGPTPEVLKNCRNINVEIIIPAFTPKVKAYDQIIFDGEIEPIIPIKDAPDEIAYEDYLLSQGIRYKSVIKPDCIVSVTEATGIMYSIKRIRYDISRKIFSSRLSSPTKEFLNTVITGDDSLLSNDTREMFTTAGLAHILALSGLHVGVICLLVSIALWPLSLLKMRAHGIVATIVLLWIYAIITGLSPSVTRAVVMSTIFLSARLLQRSYSSFNALALASIVILIFNPTSLYSLGFMLSFAAVVGILLFSNHFNPIAPRHKIPYLIASLFAISISAILTTSIISAFYFHNFPLYFLLANIAVAPLLPIFLGGGIMMITAQSIGIEIEWLCRCVDFIYSVIHHVTSFISNLPGANITNIYFSGWMFISYTFIIVMLKLSLSTRRKAHWCATGLLLTICILIGFVTKERFSSDELFVLRHSYYTDVCIKSDNKLYIVTTAPKQEYEGAVASAKFKLRDYMGKRSIDSIRISDQTTTTRHFSHNGIFIGYRNQILAVVAHNIDSTHRPKYNVNYALVCRGFKGNIIDVKKSIEPDTIVLGFDLHPSRHHRYELECAELGIPYLSLRRQPFNLRQSSL